MERMGYHDHFEGKHTPSPILALVQVAFPRVIAADNDDLTLTAVLVRGLQGSGKSTLCRALAQLTQGEWINQDEVAAGAEIS